MLAAKKAEKSADHRSEVCHLDTNAKPEGRLAALMVFAAMSSDSARSMCS